MKSNFHHHRIMIKSDKFPLLCIFDMDGVIYRLNDPISSAIETIDWLQTNHVQIAFFTNNSSQTPSTYCKKLQKMGISVKKEQIFTSGSIASEILSKKYPNGTFYVIGENGLFEVLANKGLRILNQVNSRIEDIEVLNPSNEDEAADAVLVGWDRSVSYTKFRTAMMLILNGSAFYATNDDASFPVPHAIWPGAGANVSFLATALDKKPLQIFGKPHPYGYQQILSHFQVSTSDTVMIGDRLSTDILGGNRMGIKTICIETGIHTRIDRHSFPPEYHPTKFYQSMKEWRIDLE